MIKSDKVKTVDKFVSSEKGGDNYNDIFRKGGVGKCTECSLVFQSEFFGEELWECSRCGDLRVL